MVKFPNGLATKRNISYEWPNRIVQGANFASSQSYKIKRKVKMVDE